MNAISRIFAVTAIAAVCSTSFAQDVVSPAASRPDAIATTPAKAQAANDKALKRADTATVVRTGPTVADRARQATDKVDAKVDNMTNPDGTNIATNDSRRTNRDVTLAPRVDRH